MERLNMTSYREKFQQLLRELFQFDCADLDFGIYRIMNYKRDVVEKFITQDLPKAIANELDRDALADQAQAAKELKEVSEQITQTLGKDALDGDGNLAATYHATPLGTKYMTLKTKAAGGLGRQALETNIFNHLYTFFSRYYQDGDFISKRRYSKRQRYAIPYNGEEVYLYWANNDQYYVKTAENFHDYNFTSRGVNVHFKLQAANVEQNNVKGDKRLFLPRVKETEWKEDAGELIIPFEYRPLTGQEEITYGKKNQQDAIIAEALTQILKHLKKADKALIALTTERHKNSDGEPVSFLEHHLRQYTRRNTSDFFVHKDLKGFLSLELDFYLKNEVLNLDEMESAGEDRAEGWFQITRVIKAVGGRIIEFLDQIECFQKMLWEKRKFITETQYCITVGNTDESFYPDIALCEPQWAEWKELFHIDEEQPGLFSPGKSKKDKRVVFLKAHPTLVVDTKHFNPAFVDRVLASFEELDEMTDGLLVHSENFQALNLLLEKYRAKVKCIYIDPPYNTEEDRSEGKFIYKDSFEHSSWACLLKNRLNMAHRMLNDKGVLFSSIDHNEIAILKIMFEAIFTRGNFEGLITWRRRHNQPNDKTKMIGMVSEYLLAYAKDSGALKRAGVGKLDLTGSFSNPDNDLRGDWASKPWKVGSDQSGTRYKITSPTGRVFDEEWMGDEETYKALSDDNRIIFPKNGNGLPRKKYFKTEREEEGQCATNWWEHEYFGNNAGANDTLTAMFGEKNLFSNPKPPELVRGVIQVAGRNVDVIMDFFAGSGTTGHAVINIIREDGTKRKFILAEMAQYFDTVLLPRVKKITFTPEWKDGKPGRMATQEETERGPRIVKYIRLESYEDALNNIGFDDASGQQVLKFDDYLIKYMLKWETRASETMLNVEKMARPFSYKLHIHADGQTREKVADIPETFNYLLGLHVQTRRVYDDDGRRYLVYRGRIDHRQIVVIWRETEGWQKADLERDKKFVAEKELTEGADEVFVNGDSFIPNARVLETVFKARMFAEVQA